MPARRQTVFTKLGLGKRHHARLSLATWFAPAVAAFAAEAPVLMEVAVDQDHTADWLRSGIVLAAVTGSARPAVGCNSQPLGTRTEPGVQLQGRAADSLGPPALPPTW